MSWIRRSPKETGDIIGSLVTNGEVMDKIYGCTELSVSFFLKVFHYLKTIQKIMLVKVRF